MKGHCTYDSALVPYVMRLHKNCGHHVCVCSRTRPVFGKNNQRESSGAGGLSPLQLVLIEMAVSTWRNLSHTLVLIFSLVFQVYANGIRNIDLHYIIRKLAAPVISVLLLSLCVPYVIASGIVPLLGG